MSHRKLYSLWYFLRAILIGNFTRNGSHITLSLGEVLEKYKTLHLPTVTENTRIKFTNRIERFLSSHLNTPLAYLTPEKVAQIILHAKESYVQGAHSKRYNFHKEVKDLKTLLQWWTDHYDFKFSNPVRSFHRSLAIIEEIPEKDRKISMDETIKFFKSFTNQSLYHDIAIMQFYCGGRIGEVAGIQFKNIDLETRVLKIKEVITWVRGAPKIKSFPKNGKAREVFINDTMLDIINRRLMNTPKECVFLFHNKGKALRYNRINVAFNEAWEKAGLNGKFSGSHLLRYSSAQAARKITGSLDAAASVTGHQSMKMAAHYGKLDSTELNQSALVQIEKRMKEISVQLLRDEAA